MNHGDRQTHAESTQQQYARRAYEKHCTGIVGALAGPSTRLSIQSASKGFNRDSGYCASRAALRDVRARLLLARTQMPARKVISFEHRILAAQDFQQQIARQEVRQDSATERLASLDNLAMRNERSPPIAADNISIPERSER
jgi:hypothetical protein